MASLGRNRTMPTDAAVAKFLYTIMKQLDLKSIDWQAVATELDITNGHAARMRYSRFKGQMEGTAPTTKKPKTAAPRKRKEERDTTSKPEKKRKREDESESTSEKPEKAEATASVETTIPFVKTESIAQAESLVKPEPHVKEEPLDPVLKSYPVAKTHQRVKDEPRCLAPENSCVEQDTATPTTPVPAPANYQDPLPDFFSSKEEIQAMREHEKRMLGSQTVKQETEMQVETELEH